MRIRSGRSSLMCGCTPNLHQSLTNDLPPFERFYAILRAVLRVSHRGFRLNGSTKRKTVTVAVFLGLLLLWGMPFFFLIAGAGSMVRAATANGRSVRHRALPTPTDPLLRWVHLALAHHALFPVEAPRPERRVAWPLLAVCAPPPGRLQSQVVRRGRVSPAIYYSFILCSSGLRQR
jgi:hypothetical protein